MRRCFLLHWVTEPELGADESAGAVDADEATGAPWQHLVREQGLVEWFLDVSGTGGRIQLRLGWFRFGVVVID